jgi:NADH:ubiquinone oxidoreductase subunit 5 (subunit L)/multisubunit Na+/H+ antiporter MnhA subunit
VFSFAHLSGAPFSLGYVAKHSVLTLSPHAGIYGTIVVLLLIIGACSSVFYSIEFIRCVFYEPVKSTKSISQVAIDPNQFSKFNNPTGNIGLLVIGFYYLFASALGYYLSIYLIDYSTLSLNLNPYDYTTNVANSKTLPIYGYSALSIPILTCYAILISLFFYVSRSTKVELNGPQLIV